MSFEDDFKHLTANAPFPWQVSLYQDSLSLGKFPATCNLPTGLGKTSVVAIWRLALATNPAKVPRRLVYVVNRRTVVDQTTSEVERYRDAIQNNPELGQLRETLASLCAVRSPGAAGVSSCPLALSTLRGQFADNRKWSADPALPASPRRWRNLA